MTTVCIVLQYHSTTIFATHHTVYALQKAYIPTTGAMPSEKKKKKKETLQPK